MKFLYLIVKNTILEGRLKMDYELLSNGMLENYPKKVVLKENFKVKHWMNFESVSGGEAIEDMLTDALDSIIDFEKTGLIKSSSELTMNDRKYLFFVQRIVCKGYDFNVKIEQCDKEECKKGFEAKLSLEDLKEEKIKSKFKKDTLLNLQLYPPTYNRIKEYNKLLTDYKAVKQKYLTDGLDFKFGIPNLLLKYPFLAKNEMGVDEYLDWILEQDAKVLKYVDEYIINTYHGFKRDVKIKCPHCQTMNERMIPIELDFFL